MNREEPNWLLQPLPGRRDRGAFCVGAVRAREHLLSDMADVARERGCFCSKSILDHGGHHSTECTKTQF